MPESPEAFWERVHGDLTVPPVGEWDSWPFEGELRVRPLERPVAAEPPREGEDGPQDCDVCARGDEGAIWSDEHWLLRPLGTPSGLPVVVLLETRDHVDFPDLPDDLAAELGPLLLRVHRAVASVDGIGNVHVGRWGEGSAYCHIWFLGRPARFPQLRSSFAAVWDDVLPPTPREVWEGNLDLVRRALAG